MRLARRIGGGESASVRARWHRGFIRLKHRTSFSRQPVFSMVGFGRGKMTTTIEEHYRTLIPGLGALLDFLAASHVRAVAFLVAICRGSSIFPRSTATRRGSSKRPSR